LLQNAKLWQSLPIYNSENKENEINSDTQIEHKIVTEDVEHKIEGATGLYPEIAETMLIESEIDPSKIQAKN
jgi:hypothetical protein